MKKMLKAFNKLVFLHHKTATQVYDIATLAQAIEQSALDAFATYAKGVKPSGNFVRIDRKDKMQDVLGIIYSVDYFVRKGVGFTPKLMLLQNRVMGANCFGHAIILGSLLRHERNGYKVYLGITPDHASVILESNNELYVCLSNDFARLKKMHGTLVEHEGYRWYTCSEKDDFNFTHIAIQDFEKGVINAMVESFIFLQENSKKRMQDEYIDEHAFNDPGFKIRTRVHTTNWKYFQKKYLAELNGYRTRYEKEYLLDCLRTEHRRAYQRMRNKFDKIIAGAFQNTLPMRYTPDLNKKFIQAYVPLLQTVRAKLNVFLENGEYMISLPKRLERYLKSIKYGIEKDPSIKEFVIERFDQLLSSQRA